MISEPLKGDELTRHDNIAAMIESYERAKQHIIRGFQELVFARDEFQAHFALGSHELRVCADRYSRHQIALEPDHALLELKKQAWIVIIDRLELGRVMPNSEWKKLQQTIEKETEKLPEISLDTVNAFVVQNLRPSNLASMIEASIVEVFDWLRPRQWDRYKRNSANEIPVRQIITNLCEEGLLVKFRVRYSESHMLLALERVLRFLDGRGQVPPSYKSELEQAIDKSVDGSGETEFFVFRAYRNRNLHLTWRRVDLLKRLNEIGGKGLLRREQAEKEQEAIQTG